MKELLRRPASIKNIRLALGNKDLCGYILESKIKNERIYDEIILNSKLNIINKLNMIKSVN